MMRLFQLQRDDDESRVSGVGVVAEGVEFSNGNCSLSWLTSYNSIGIYPNIKELERIHGHEGKTRVVWVTNIIEATLTPTISVWTGEKL